MSGNLGTLGILKSLEKLEKLEILEIITRNYGKTADDNFQPLCADFKVVRGEKTALGVVIGIRANADTSVRLAMEDR